MIQVILSILILVWIFLRYLLRQKSNSLGCLLGKTAIVTGGNSGLGLGTCLLLASRGCRIIVADKDNSDKSIKEIKRKTGNPNISYKFLDLSSLKKVREFVEDLKKTEEKIDILINNAGVPVCRELKTEDGLNSVMQINYFGCFLLTHLLLDLLKKSSDARVVFTSSITIFLKNYESEILNPLDDIGSNYIPTVHLYGFSKLCNVLASQEFAKKLKNTNITFNSIDPTLVLSSLFRKSEEIHSYFEYKIYHRFMEFVFGNKPLVCAQTTLDIVTTEKFHYKNGGHYCCLLPMLKPKVLRNEEFCNKIWKMTEELVKLQPEERILEFSE